MQLKIDLHVHTTKSYDGLTRPESLPDIVMQRGLDGVALTEHDVLSKTSVDGILVVPGIEVSTRNGHLIGLGVSRQISRGSSAEETMKEIRDQGGVCIVPHPYDYTYRSVNPTKLKVLPEALETVNAAATFFTISKWLAERAAHRLGLPMVAGSDSHTPGTIGDAYTVVETKTSSIEDILDAIRAGNTTPYGKATALREKLTKLGFRIRSNI